MKFVLNIKTGALVNQNLSFLKKKSTAGCFSLEGSGELYLYKIRLKKTQDCYLPIDEDALDLLLECFLGLSGVELLLGDDALELSTCFGELTSDSESSGEKVVVVDLFDEWLKGSSSLHLVLVFNHSLGNLEWVSLNTSD